MKKLLSLGLLLVYFGGLSAVPAFSESKNVKTSVRREKKKSYSGKSRSRYRRGAQTNSSPMAEPSPSPLPKNPPALAAEAEESGDTSGILSGNQIVNVSSNSNIIVKIGLAPHGIALIDFPANDPIYEIHPADENYVTVGCRRREQTADTNKVGRCLDNPKDGIILRPGTAFNEFANGVDSSTIVTIQRVSGLVATIIVFPVKRITQNANYLAFRYDAQKVAQNRAAAGLSFNLNDQTEVLINSPVAPEKNNTIAQNQDAGKSGFLQVNLKQSGDDTSSAENNEEKSSLPEAVETELLSELRRVGITKPIVRFGKPVHGLALALASHSARLTDYSVEVIAVKNTLGIPLRLIPEQPNLVIESVGEKDKSSVLSQDVAVLIIASNAGDEDVIRPGETYYFAFAYKSPILGAKQILKASFAHRAAADEPATLTLGEIAK